MTRDAALIVHPAPDEALLDALLSECGRVVVLSMTRDLPGRSELGPRIVQYRYRPGEDLVALARAIDRDARIAVAPPVWEGGVEATSAICAALGLRGNSPAAARAARDKYRAAKCFAHRGVPHPRTMAFSTSPEVRARIERAFAFPFIIKSPWSTNSQSVSLVRNADELRSSLAMLRRLYDPRRRNRLSDLYADGEGDAAVLAQDFIVGVELNLDILFEGSSWRLLGAFEKHPMRGPTFEEVQSVYPPNIPAETLDRCASTAAEAARALGGTIGAAHVELRLTAAGPVVIEAALRPGGFLTPQAIARLTGVHPAAALTRLLVTGELPSVPAPPERLACLYGAVNCGAAGRIRSISDERAVRNGAAEIVAFRMLKRAGERVLPLPLGTDYHLASFLLVGKTREMLESTAQRIRERLHVVIAP